MRKHITTRHCDSSQNMRGLFNGNQSEIQSNTDSSSFDQFGEFLLRQENSSEKVSTAGEHGWLDREFEGQLSVDVYETPDAVVIRSAIAGVRPEDLDIFFENEMLTIRGYRYLNEDIQEECYFYKECYWGGFSRSIILPVDVDTDDMSAALDNGVLTVVVGKHFEDKKIRIPIVENNS